MEIVITGHTSGIGKHLSEYLSAHNIIGASRSNGKSLESIHEWFPKDADVFINNAFDDENIYSQGEAFEYVYRMWKTDTSKKIISISSNAGDWDGEDSYREGKMYVDMLHRDEYQKFQGVYLTVLRPGWVDTPRVEKAPFNKMDPVEVSRVVSFVLNSDIRIKEITFQGRT
mgnify:FL=1